MVAADEIQFRNNQSEGEGMVSVLREILKKLEVLDNRMLAVENQWQGRTRKEEEAADEEEKRLIAELEGLHEEDSYLAYVDSFVAIVSRLKLSDEDEVALFVKGLRKGNTKLITVLNPKTLQHAIAFGRALTLDEDLYRSKEEAGDMMVESALPVSWSNVKHESIISSSKTGQGTIKEPLSGKMLTVTKDGGYPTPLITARRVLISNDGKCKGFDWRLQGIELVAGVLFMPISECEISLGLEGLISIRVDRRDLPQWKMELCGEGNQTTLQAEGGFPWEIKEGIGVNGREVVGFLDIPLQKDQLEDHKRNTISAGIGKLLKLGDNFFDMSAIQIPDVTDSDDFQEAMQMVKPTKKAITHTFIFRDGIMVATDYRVSMCDYMSSQSVKKIIEVNPYTSGTMGGTVDSQFWYTNLGINCQPHEMANILYSYRGMSWSVDTVIIKWDEMSFGLCYVISGCGFVNCGDMGCASSRTGIGEICVPREVKTRESQNAKAQEFPLFSYGSPDVQEGDVMDELNQLSLTRDAEVGITRPSRVFAQFLPPDGSRMVKVSSGKYELWYSFLSQKGYYLDALDKANQDSFYIHTPFGTNPDDHFFVVFDSHGECGVQYSQFVKKKKLCENLLRHGKFRGNTIEVCHSSFPTTNSQLHADVLDDTMSGTTSITILVRGRTLYVVNCGDFRDVIAKKRGKDIVAVDLPMDQTPFREDECERVMLCGAWVLTLDQIEGLKNPDVKCWGTEEGDDDDPPRLWVPNRMYPGTTFTRSTSDSIVETIRVAAIPEIVVLELTPSHFFVFACDACDDVCSICLEEFYDDHPSMVTTCKHEFHHPNTPHSSKALVQLQGSDPKDTTWTFLFDQHARYPNYILEDKDVAEGEVLMQELYGGKVQGRK